MLALGMTARICTLTLVQAIVTVTASGLASVQVETFGQQCNTCAFGIWC